MKYSGVGGQAVLEGIMMKNRETYAVAVRLPDGEIRIREEQLKEKNALGKRLRRIPFIRGIFSLVDSLVLGMSTLEYSASFFEEEEETKPGLVEKKLGKEAADKLTMGFSVVLALVLCLGIFMVLPVFLTSRLKAVVSSGLTVSLVEGVLRVLLFVGYIWLISRMKDIRRVFMYHGAEHKCINCIEHGLPLTVENVRNSSKEHPRCGTSFLLFVMIVSVAVSIFLPKEILWQRLLSRLLMLPVVVGISYEFIRLAGSSDSAFARIMSKPGLWLQGLTTREPEDDQIEVGIRSVEAVFDWKRWQREELGIMPEENA